MSVVAVTHGYPPAWNLGGEVSLHRTMRAIRGHKTVLTQTDHPYDLDGVHVDRLNVADPLNPHTDPAPIARQLAALDARVVIAQNEISNATVVAAKRVGTLSIVSVHAPRKYGSSTRASVPTADHVVYNTHACEQDWGRPGFVLHPPVGDLPSETEPTGDAYTLLSSLKHKGASLVLDLAERMPAQRFIIVESPVAAMKPVDLYERVARLPNVSLLPRVAPDRVADEYLSQTRIILVPGRYETYGMSAIEAAGHSIPAVHVDTPHVREGIGTAAELVPSLNVDAVQQAIERIERSYTAHSDRARARAEEIAARQSLELDDWADFIE